MKRPSELAALIRAGRSGRTRRVATVRFARTGWAAPAAAILPGLVALLAFGLRLGWPLETFSDGHLDFHGTDAWFHLRVIDDLARGVAPAPRPAFVPLFDVAVARIARLIARGVPSDRLVDVVAALLPPLLGAAAVLCVFVLGARVFGRRAGLLAAALAAVMPGPFFARTLAGFADYHALEATLAVVTIVLLVHALDAEAAGRSAWRVMWTSLLAGAALAGYLATWAGGVLLVLVLGVWAVTQSVLDAIHSRPQFGLTRAILPAAAVALAGVLFLQGPDLPPRPGQIGALLVLGAVVAFVDVGRWALVRWRLPRLVFPVAVLGAVWLGGQAVAALAPGLAAALPAAVAGAEPGMAQRLSGDMQPLLYPAGRLSLDPAWTSYRAALVTGLAGLALLMVRLVRRGRRADGLLVVWSVATIAATLAQRRFGYYLGPNLALLSGGALAAAFAAVGRGARPAVPERTRDARRRLASMVTLAGLTAAVFAANLPLQIGRGDTVPGQPRAWHEALEWLRVNTPEPGGNPDGHHPRHAGFARAIPPYTVLTDRPDGSWVARTARRVPVASAAGAEVAGRFFTAIDEDAADRMLRRINARYIVFGDDLPFRTGRLGRLTGSFGEMVSRAGEDPSAFYERYMERREDGSLRPVWIFYPRYYRTMAVRLGVFGGSAVEPARSTWVIAYAQRTSDDGEPYREIVESRLFDTYPEAEEHLRSLGPGPYRIVGRDPRRTSVPLAPLDSFAGRFSAPADGHEAAVAAYEYLTAKSR